MKILVNRKPVKGPWGGGNNFVKALCSELVSEGHVVTHSLDSDIDCFFIVDPRPDNDCPGIANYIQNHQKFSNVKVVHRVNECDARKNTEHVDGMLLNVSQFVDKTIFVSNWMRSYFENKGWRCKDNTFIHNGVDLKNYYPDIQKTQSKKVSFVTHHWSNNILKGFDAYEFLDYLAGKNLIDFTYIGRHRNSFSSTICVSPCAGKELADNLKKHDVYISGSRFDPGPNHVLESIACGLPTYVHSDGGGSVEFAGNNHTFRNLSELESLILRNSFVKNDYQPTSWNQSIQAYIKEIVS